MAKRTIKSIDAEAVARYTELASAAEQHAVDTVLTVAEIKLKVYEKLAQLNVKVDDELRDLLTKLQVGEFAYGQYSERAANFRQLAEDAFGE